MRALYVVILSASLLAGCSVDSLSNKCATLDKSVSERENEIQTEHQDLLDEMKNKYVYFGFKDKLGMAAAGMIADPDEKLIQLSKQYTETVEAMSVLGQDQCKKKLELSEKRVSLLSAKLELTRKILDERIMEVIEKTHESASR
jgi:hypothetical protein